MNMDKYMDWLLAILMTCGIVLVILVTIAVATTFFHVLLKP